MKLTLSTNPERGGDQSALSKNWKSTECTINSEDDVRDLFSQYAYSPHIWTDGERKSHNWIHTPSCVILDMDGGKPIADAQQLFAGYQYLLFTTKSHQAPKNKQPAADRYRVVLPLVSPITDKAVYRRLSKATLFAGFDSCVFEPARYFFPSPDNCLVHLNLDGKLLEPESLKYTSHGSGQTPAPASANPAAKVSHTVSGTAQPKHTMADLQRIRQHCQPMQEAFQSIEGNTNAGTPGHNRRIAVANIIRNTIDDTGYLHKLFQNVADYNQETTQRHYDSLDRAPITCAAMQQLGVCPADCQLMQDIGKKSPISFAYRKQSHRLELNQDLLRKAADSDAFRELLFRARSLTDPIAKDDLERKIATATGKNHGKIKQMIKELVVADDPELEEACRDWWRIEKDYYEAVRLSDSGTYDFTRRGREDVEFVLGKDAKHWIIRNKRLHGSLPIMKLGGGEQPLSYVLQNDEIHIHCGVRSAQKKDSGLISTWLEGRFGGYAGFIKQWIALYTYTNFVNLPILILTGPRGVGKSVFAEIIGEIYPQLWQRYDPGSSFTEHNAAKLATIDEADEIENEKLYPLVKQIGGSAKLMVNNKYGRKYEVRNNLNLILLSNNRIPLYLKASEEPADETNNQFFVYRFPELMGGIDSNLKKKLLAELGDWLHGDIRALYEQLKSRSNADSYRYAIPVPITADERDLFRNNKSEIDLLIEEEILPYLKVGYLLSRDLDDLAEQRGCNKHVLKKQLVSLGILSSSNAEKPKRNLIGLQGVKISSPTRYYRLTSDSVLKLGLQKRKSSAAITMGADVLHNQQVLSY